jgi:G3E family GTPase
MSNGDLHEKTALRIPVTIVTGFLGAGKTTLLSQIVKQVKDKRIAVIQNEVSEEMGIESAVVTDSEGRIIPDFFELPNGCICCTAKDDMIIALENIVTLGRERIDAVVVETTGIAEPCSVAEIFWVDNELCSSIQLDGIVCVVDCLNFSDILRVDHDLGHFEIGRRQVAIADRILVNKTDLVGEDGVRGTTELIKALNPSAEVVLTSRSQVNADWVLNIGSFKEGTKLLDTLSHVQVSSVDHVFVSLPNALIHRSLLDRIVGEMLWEATCGSVYRAKGIFRSDEGEWYSLQAVGSLFETRQLPSANQIELNRENGDAKFLFIGRELNESRIKENLVRALV